MQVFGGREVRLVMGIGIVLATSGCRNEGGSADTDGNTDTDTTTGIDPTTDTDTDTDTEGEPEPVTTELTVTVTFGNDMMMTATNSLHVWVLRPRMDMAITCGDLVSDEVDPYDLQLLRLADEVNLSPSDPTVIDAVEVGDGFVYVEGVSVGGTAELAGCGGATLAQPSTSIEIALGLAGTFDCSDPATEEGAPCDDGSFCTVGETCNGGTCSGGTTRDCSILADQCNAASCTEQDGCVVEPVPNDTTCSDGLACTLGDSCQQGSCVGVLRDCDAEAPVCQQSAGCQEPTGTCLFVDADENLPCDDGLFCEINSICVSGACVGEPRVCPGDDCNVAACDELNQMCTSTFADNTTSCDDTANECTADTGLCDGSGACVAAAANEGLACNDGVPGMCVSGDCI
jgi:hypothetical protein